MNNKKIQLESEIIQILWRDNVRGNTFHFVWSDTGSQIVLELITHNTMNHQNFLLRRVAHSTDINCLLKMKSYLEETHKEEYNWTVIWIDENGHKHPSYFRAANEEEVRAKFNYDNSSKSTIEEIRQNPIS